MSEPTVFIIDDDPSARRGLTRLVQAAGFSVQSFASATNFLATEKHCEPGCILLDVKMPEMTGPELQTELSKNSYSLPIVFLSAFGDVPTTARAMKLGAIDFLTKPVDRETLMEAIHLSLKKSEEDRTRRAESEHIAARLKQLTPREYEVMIHVATGMLNKQIAGELGIAEDTVKIHRGRVMRKLGVTSVAALVRLCEKARIPSPNSAAAK